MKTKEKKESSFLNRLFTGVSLVYLLLGVLLIVIPDLQMEYVCYGISVVLVIIGIIVIVKYFLEESYKNLNQYGFSIGVFLVIIGVCTLVKNQEMAKSFQLYIGVCILLTAIIKLQNAMDLKALKDRTWGVICVVSLVIVVCAVLIIMNPFSNRNYEIALTYFSLLFDGIISLFSYHYLAFRIRQNEKKSRVRKETKEFAEKQELEFSDAPSMDESTEPEDLQQATDSVSGTGDEWELEEKEQEEDSEQGDIHV